MDKPRNRIGLYSLVAAAAGFLFFSFQPWIPFDRLRILPSLGLGRLLFSFFEASLVGSLADWFAVSALFHDPLGLGLPHTDIIAKNKDAIAEAVPRFLVGFVSDERIAGELARIDYAGMLEAGFGGSGKRAGLDEFLRAVLSDFLGDLGARAGEGPGNLARLVDELCVFVDTRIDVVQPIAKILRWAQLEGVDQRALEVVAGLLAGEIGRNRSSLAQTLTPLIKRNAGWQGIFIGRNGVERFLSGVEEELTDIRINRSNEMRKLVLASLDDYAATLAGERPDPTDERARIAGLFHDILGDAGFRRGLVNLVSSVIGRIGEDLSRGGRGLPEALSWIGNRLVGKLSSDLGVRGRFNSGVAGLLASFVTGNRIVAGLSDWLAGLLKATSPDEFVSRVEGAVWNDLQYIRLNGALVGGLVGLLLAFVGALR